MRGDFVELAAQGVLVVLYGIGALGTAGIGLLIEYHSYIHLLAGEYPIAGWLGAIGAIVLFFTFLIVRDKLLPNVQAASN